MKNKTDYLKQAWLVLLLSILFGASLAFVQVVLNDKINNNKLSETMNQIPELVPGANTAIETFINGKKVYKAMNQSKQIGWVVPSLGMGFADKIEILIGLDTSLTKITGVYVLDQKETPGLGNKIVEQSFRKQFISKPTNKIIEAIKSNQTKDHQITAVTGATISSVSVCDIINSNIKKIKEKIENQKKV